MLVLISKAVHAEKWHELCDFDEQGRFGVFMNVLLYGDDGFILNAFHSGTYYTSWYNYT